jgi:two-component system response regulator
MSAGNETILLVEDNAGDAELTMMAFERQSLSKRVVHVRDGVEALDYLLCRGAFASRPPGTPALVFLDLKMPMLDGFVVLSEIRAAPSICHVPVVVLTSSNVPTDRRRAYEAGANAYMCKPVDFVEFMESMRCACQFWTQVNHRVDEDF